MFIQRELEWPCGRDSLTAGLRDARPGLRVVIGGLFWLAASGTAGAIEVRVEYLDGRTLTGEWLGAPEGRQVRVDTSAECRPVPLDDLITIEFDVSPAAPVGNTLFHLADGGRLHGDIVGQGDEALVCRTGFHDALHLKFSRLAGIVLGDGEHFVRAADLFRAAMRDRLSTQDVLITRDVEDVKVLRGRLASLGREEGAFIFGEQPRTFRTEKIFGIVFADTGVPSTRHAVTVHLTEGSNFSGRLLHADNEVIRFIPSFHGEARNRVEIDAGEPLPDGHGSEWRGSARRSTVGVGAPGGMITLPVAIISQIRVRSDRIVYLSDLPTVAERVEGRLHRPWPVQRDRSVSGGLLTIDGEQFRKGLGVHSRTELTYDLAGGYAVFRTTIGIDDAVRPRGSVVFRVLGDGETLFESGTVTGIDDPQPVSVDVLGVRTLTLVVDYGEALDLADHADWGGARLLKARVAPHSNDRPAEPSA